MTLDSRVAFSSRRMFVSWPVAFVLDEFHDASVSASSSLFFILGSFCFVVYTISMKIRLQSIQLNDRSVRVRAHVNIVFDNWFSFYLSQQPGETISAESSVSSTQSFPTSDRTMEATLSSPSAAKAFATATSPD
jgi:hypothetical protein